MLTSLVVAMRTLSHVNDWMDRELSVVLAAATKLSPILSGSLIERVRIPARK